MTGFRSRCAGANQPEHTPAGWTAGEWHHRHPAASDDAYAAGLAAGLADGASRVNFGTDLSSRI